MDTLRALNVARHVRESILGGEFMEKPWPVVILKDVLPLGEYGILMEELKNFRRREIKTIDNREFSPLASHEVIGSAFRMKEVAEAVVLKMGFSGRFDPRITYDRPGLRIGIHPDIATKAGTLQVYLTEEPVPGMGTRLHDPRTRDFVFEVPFVPNGGYLFRRGDLTLHSVSRVARPRWSLLVPIWKGKES